MDLFIDKTVLSVKEVESFQDTPSLVQGLKNAGANLNGRALQNGEELVEETYSSSSEWREYLYHFCHTSEGVFVRNITEGVPGKLKYKYDYMCH